MCLKKKNKKKWDLKNIKKEVQPLKNNLIEQ